MSLFVALLFVLALQVAVLLLFRQYRVVRRQHALNPDWLHQISIDRYRPMLRLLDDQDFRLLRSQPGFTSDMTERVRLQRCQIFRRYLRSLSSDFAQVVMALKVVMAQSSTDRPDLARVLVRMQILFALGMMLAHLRLQLYRWGIGRVEIAPLVNMFNFVREKLRTLAPGGQAC